MADKKGATLSEVLPKAGLVVSEKGNLTEILCKPKIMPLKSITLQKLEEMEQKVATMGRVDGNNPENFTGDRPVTRGGNFQ